MAGEEGTGLSQMGISAVAAQTATGVRCVYGAFGAAAADSGAGAFQALKDAGAMEHTTLVACSPDASLAERYAATCAAFAVAEGARAEVGLSLLDDASHVILHSMPCKYTQQPMKS